jgi:hypothetical protein
MAAYMGFLLLRHIGGGVQEGAAKGRYGKIRCIRL